MPRAQSAMEYLMTYGWAMLVIAIALVSFYSYGIFNLSSRTATGCIVASGFTCTQPVLISSGSLTAGVGIVGRTLLIKSIGCSANSTIPTVWVSTPITLASGQVSQLTFKCPIGAVQSSEGSTFKGTLWINYTTGSGNIDQEIGQVNVPLSGGNQTYGSVTCIASPSVYNVPSGNTPYSVVVPPNCGNVVLLLVGGPGNYGSAPGGYEGGYSGTISGNYAIPQGITTLYVWVAQGSSISPTGGTPGGGNGAYSTSGGGGGCSVVGTANSISNPYVLIVAAGGGGGGGGEATATQGGNGGGATGSAGGLPVECSAEGQGGTPTSGGNGGTCPSEPQGGAGGPYSGGNGVGTVGSAGGGGGCGYYGGGGGTGFQSPTGGAGGGGGSSWANTVVVGNIINLNGFYVRPNVTMTWYN
ncbi:MAG: hypothetical protein KGH94_01435 [Candidatus Micrarchaeota archaeon]|nr:hypothetical protein [Candidatus Micrarchaeota archaeon]